VVAQCWICCNHLGVVLSRTTISSQKNSSSIMQKMCSRGIGALSEASHPHLNERCATPVLAVPDVWDWFGLDHWCLKQSLIVQVSGWDFLQDVSVPKQLCVGWALKQWGGS
jgi:hypothetical protein